MGASRGRLARSLLLENALLSALAAIAGAWLAYFGVRLLVRLLPSQLAFFNANEIRIDGRVLLGGRFRLTGKEPWHHVVGVANDVKLSGLDDRFGPFEFYYSWSRTRGWNSLKVAVRVSADSAATLPALKQRIG